MKEIEEDMTIVRDFWGELFVNRRQEGRDMVKMLEGKKKGDEFVLLVGIKRITLGLFNTSISVKDVFAYLHSFFQISRFKGRHKKRTDA